MISKENCGDHQQKRNWCQFPKQKLGVKKMINNRKEKLTELMTKVYKIRKS